MKTFKIVNNDISDGYHTFDELYEHRVLLYLNCCMMVPKQCYYREDYKDWFCVYMQTDHGQISYHLPNKYLALAKRHFSSADECAIEWDGHTSNDVVARLESLIGAIHPRPESAEKDEK